MRFTYKMVSLHTAILLVVVLPLLSSATGSLVNQRNGNGPQEGLVFLVCRAYWLQFSLFFGQHTV